jgi:cell division protein FtsB
MNTMKILAILSALVMIGVALLAVRVAHNRRIERLERKLDRLRGRIDRLKRRFDHAP